MERFFSPKFRWRPKKKRGASPSNGTLFFPRIQVDTYAQMHTRVKLLGRNADVDHTQTIEGYSQIIGGIYPPIPPRFRHPWLLEQLASTFWRIGPY